MRNAHLVCALVTALFAAAGCAGAAPKAEIAPKAPEAAKADGGEGGPITVYVVRHAEKALSADAPKDPPLTAQGAQRAAALAREIDVASLVAVYSTPYARTKSTAQPSTEWADLPVTEYAADDTPGLVAKIRALRTGAVLVVGHSNTVPEIVKALGVTEIVTLGDGDFGDLFVITLSPDGTATMERERFGD